MDQLQLISLNKSDFKEIVSAFSAIGWHKPQSTYEVYYKDQEKSIREVIVAKLNNQLVDDDLVLYFTKDLNVGETS